MGDSITEGTIVSWEKEIGDFVDEDEGFVVVETDKVSVDITAPEAGILEEIYAQEGDTIEVGGKLAKFKRSEAPAETESSTEQETPSEPEAAASTTATTTETPVPTPEAPKSTPTPPPKKPKKQEIEEIKPPPGTRTERRVKMTRMRQRISERLLQSQQTTASLTTFNEIDMSNLMSMRSKYKDLFLDKHDAKLGFMSAFVHASSLALQELPIVNSSIDGDEIIYHDYVDISIAVSSPRGLVVPVLRNVETMSFGDIESNIAKLGLKAREDKLTLEEMSGGTFSVTNGGVFGSLLSTPILNLPQAAILGMHGIKKRPIVDENGEISIRPMMYVALTYNHMIIDGRESVTFLKTIKEYCEDPNRMLLHV